jgi:hypothetical protein
MVMKAPFDDRLSEAILAPIRSLPWPNIRPDGRLSQMSRWPFRNHRCEEKTANSVDVGKSAVLPDAGGANSAAPTVQSGDKPLKVSPDCPADSKPK